MNWYLHVLRNYANFNGRARRAEYWWFTLWTTLVGLVLFFVDLGLGLLDTATYYGVLGSLYTLGTVIPWLAVQVRRLHDTGRSGWWALLAMPITVYFFVEAILVAFGRPVDPDDIAMGLAALASMACLLVLVIFSVLDGQPKTNAYGPDPKGRGVPPPVAAWSDAGAPTASEPAALRIPQWQGSRTGKSRTIAVSLVLLLVLVMAAATGFALWTKEVATGAGAGVSEGRQEGFVITQVACVDRALERSKVTADRSPAELGIQFGRLVGCLDTSERVPGFCSGVPTASPSADRIGWNYSQCARIDAPEDMCIGLMEVVIEYCRSGRATVTG